MVQKKPAEVERFLTAPDAGVRAALIFGKDRGGVRERANRLAAVVTADPNDPFDVALLTETDLEGDPARLEDELSALSLMGGRRLVRLKLTAPKPGVERTAATALTRHADGALNPDAFLIIEAGALAAASPLRKAADAAKAAASVPVYEDEAADVARLVRESLKQDGVALTPDALELFVARLPRERGVARSEIERLILYLGPGSGRQAGPDDLVDHLGVEPEASLGDAAVDAFGGRAALAQAALRRARAEGEDGVSVVRALGQHLALLRRVAALSDEGVSAREAVERLRVFWKTRAEIQRQARGWRSVELEALSADLVEADQACKQTGAPAHLISERLALSIAARARRLGL